MGIVSAHRCSPPLCFDVVDVDFSIIYKASIRASGAKPMRRSPNARFNAIFCGTPMLVVTVTHCCGRLGLCWAEVAS